MTDPATLGIPDAPELVAISARLEVGQVEAIDRLADQTGRTRTDILRMLLDRALGRTAA